MILDAILKHFCQLFLSPRLVVMDGKVCDTGSLRILSGRLPVDSCTTGTRTVLVRNHRGNEGTLQLGDAYTNLYWLPHTHSHSAHETRRWEQSIQFQANPPLFFNIFKCWDVFPFNFVRKIWEAKPPPPLSWFCSRTRGGGGSILQDFAQNFRLRRTVSPLEIPILAP